MLKNLDWKTLLLSKTFWLGGVVSAIPFFLTAAGKWKTDKAGALESFLTALGIIGGAIGIKDATSGSIN